jgi:phage tail sheath protein FI
MAGTYTTPGVYVEEISTLPRSVAGVSTAIPAFLGYTERGEKLTPTRIETMMEYEQSFGGPPDALKQVETKRLGGTSRDPAYDVGNVTTKDTIPLLYYSLRLYFDNGGGPCYIVRLADDSDKPDLKHFQSGLEALMQEDEPTLIAMPDATRLDESDFKIACEKVLEHCGRMKNRFAILDVKEAKSKPEDAFRGLASEQLSYGAAYTPYLRTALAFAYDETKVDVLRVPNAPKVPVTFEATLGEIVVAYKPQPKAQILAGTESGDIKFEVQDTPGPKLTITLNAKDRTAGQVLGAWTSLSDKKGFDLRLAPGKTDATKVSAPPEEAALVHLPSVPVTFEATLGEIVVTYKPQQPKAEILGGTESGDIKFEVRHAPGPKLTITLNAKDRTAGQVLGAWGSLNDKRGFELRAAKTNETKVSVAPEEPLDPLLDAPPLKLYALKSVHTGLYNQVKASLAKQRVTLPPSGAVAGIYARVDRDRGVWKAPANVAVASVIDLTRTFTDAQQGALNVDPTGGKSINVIRSFTGRGTLVWGARTLAGNDNEWRYIPVRRLFISIEESTKRASAFAVFEPNDATTWLKVRAMIESYLYGLWERGALAGSRPEAAYFVNVGLGKTMTPQDVLEGRMIVEIGVAAVRPSEFIILRFTHQLQAA